MNSPNEDTASLLKTNSDKYDLNEDLGLLSKVEDLYFIPFSNAFEDEY